MDRIRAKDYVNLVDTMATGRWNQFEFEFGDLVEYAERHIRDSEYPSDIGRNNERKNRYEDVFPYDNEEKRVVLSSTDGASDYINASWVSDYPIKQNKKKYICSQGPMVASQDKDDTRGDFWRMIIEKNVTCIVMLTQLVEEEIDKCSQYWPDNGSVNYNGIQVELVNSVVQEDIFQIRNFKVTKGNDSDTRNVIQCHFLKWKDRGVPEEDDFYKLVDKVDQLNKEQKEQEAPILVHCSAGVGRSGVFCVVRSYINYIKNYVNEKKKNYQQLVLLKLFMKLEKTEWE